MDNMISTWRAARQHLSSVLKMLTDQIEKLSKENEKIALYSKNWYVDCKMDTDYKIVIDVRSNHERKFSSTWEYTTINPVLRLLESNGMSVEQLSEMQKVIETSLDKKFDSGYDGDGNYIGST